MSLWPPYPVRVSSCLTRSFRGRLRQFISHDGEHVPSRGLPARNVGSSDQPQPSGESSRVATIFDLQLVEDVGDVELDGTDADVEPVANLSIAEVLAEQPQHVSFTASQLKRRRRGWLRRQHMLTLR